MCQGVFGSQFAREQQVNLPRTVMRTNTQVPWFQESYAFDLHEIWFESLKNPHVKFMPASLFQDIYWRHPAV